MFNLKFISSKSIALKNLLFESSQFDVLARNITRLGFPALTDAEHLDAAIDWLCHAHDATGRQGVSAGYMMTRGWQPPYPETTGYIIPTLIQYSETADKEDYLTRAIEMGQWEVDIQMESGATHTGMGIEGEPTVFNTGQVMIGWLALYEKTNENKYLHAAIRAGDWLVGIQAEDGRWDKYVYRDMPHAYHTRVAWPLAKLFQLTGAEKYRISATKNVQWTLSVLEPNGWSKYMAFGQYELPFTHTVAYTFRGLIECAGLLPEIHDITMSTIITGMDEIAKKYETGEMFMMSTMKYPPSRLNRSWESKDSDSCLTGNAQLSIIYLQLHEITGEQRYLYIARRFITLVKKTQSLRATNPAIRGGIPGSFPIWGQYMGLIYPNWATKFFADTLMLKMKLTEHG